MKSHCELVTLTPRPVHPLNTVVAISATDPSDAAVTVEHTIVTEFSCPSLSSASVDGQTLTLDYDGKLPTAGAPPSAGPPDYGFTVKVDGVAVKFEFESVSGTQTILTLSEPVGRNQAVTVSHAPGDNARSVGFTDQSVTVLSSNNAPVYAGSLSVNTPPGGVAEFVFNDPDQGDSVTFVRVELAWDSILRKIVPPDTSVYDLVELTINGSAASMRIPSASELRTLNPPPPASFDTAVELVAVDPSGATGRARVVMTTNWEPVPSSPGTPSFGAAQVQSLVLVLGDAMEPAVLPEPTGGDGVLAYTLTGPDGAGLPAGLAFDAAVRTLSGTPTAVQAATTYTYTATDADGDAATLTFAITVVEDLVDLGCKPLPSTTARATVSRAFAGSGGRLDNYDAAVTLELEENRDGSKHAVELGCVALADPDRKYSYSISAGDRSRFAVGASDGALRYVGGGESAEQTPEYVLTVKATPRGGGPVLTLEVRVAVVAVDDRGVVTLSTMEPLIGERLSASLADLDGVVSGTVEWQWWRRKGMGDAWSVIDGAGAAHYTPRPADGGFHLQARAGYRDMFGDQTAASARTKAVDMDSARRERLLQIGLSGVGRTVATTAVNVIGQRFLTAMRPAGDAGPMHVGVTLNQRSVALSQITDGQARAEAVRGVAEALGVRVLPDGEAILEAPSAAQLLSNSAFRVEHRAGAASWGVWGAGDLSGFATDVDGFEQDTTVLSGYVGVDYRFVSNALAGLAASYSKLDLVSTSAEAGDASLKGALVSVYPYGLWMPDEWLGLWSLAGVGMGRLELTDVGRGMDGDIRSWLGAVGQRAELWSDGAVSVAVKSDGFVTGLTASDALPDVSAHVWRARVLMEVGLELRMEDARFGGLIELGGRLDGGDAERGLGAEAGGELSYTHPGIGIGLTGRGRLLLVHEYAGIRDWGASMALTLEPPGHGPGLAVSVVPTWGDPDSGTGALWQEGELLFSDDDGSTLVRASESWLPQATEVRVGYGLDLLHGAGRVAPFAEVGFEHAVHRSLGAGATLNVLGADLPYDLELEVYGERTVANGQAPRLQLGLGGSLEY